MTRDAWHRRGRSVHSGSPGKARQRRWGNAAQSDGRWVREVRREVGPQKQSKRRPWRHRREPGRGSYVPRGPHTREAWSATSWGWESYDYGQESSASYHPPAPCAYFRAGYCGYGSSCYFSHSWPSADQTAESSEPSEPQLEKSAGLRFCLAEDAVNVLRGPPGATLTTLHTGPMRPRVVGNLEELGLSEDGSWDPQTGLDLCWCGDGWKSMVIPVAPDAEVEFCVLRLDQATSHPGLMQAWERCDVHDARQFTWGPQLSLLAPGPGQVAEIDLLACHCDASTQHLLTWKVVDREEVVARPGCQLPWAPQPVGVQRCFTFDASTGVTLKFNLYLPESYEHDVDDLDVDMNRWPLVLFLHSMHGKLDGDNNMFFESDTPLRLLHGDERCPVTLKEKCILLAPQCPVDGERGDAAGIWMRRGWYEDSHYDPQVEVALAELVELVRDNYRVDPANITLVGSSMGAYGALELASRWPSLFVAVGLVAAHYDLEPIGPLVERLAGHELPLWFIHAVNDNVCPFADVENLVRQLRRASRAEIRLTSYEDTWSSQGHCSDRVAFWAYSTDPAVPACGEDLFVWLTSRA